jgi:hypothetical protein
MNEREKDNERVDERKSGLPDRKERRRAASTRENERLTAECVSDVNG